MNFPDLVRETKRRTGRPATTVSPVAKAFLAAILDGLARGEDVSIFGFGRFYVKKLPDAVCRDFPTGRLMKVAGKERVRFTAGARTTRAVAARKKRKR